MAPDDLYSTLLRFHRDVTMPELRDEIRGSEQRLRNDFLTHFDEIYRKLERLETEYQSSHAMMNRIVERLGEAVAEDEKRAIQEQIRHLKREVAELQRRIEELEHAM